MTISAESSRKSAKVSGRSTTQSLDKCSTTSSRHHSIYRRVALSLHHSQRTKIALGGKGTDTFAAKASTGSTKSPRRRLCIAQRTCRRRMSETRRRRCGVTGGLPAQRRMRMRDLGGCTSCVLQGGPDCVVLRINAGSCRQDCFVRMVKRPQRQVNRPQGREGRKVLQRKPYIWTDPCARCCNSSHTR